MVGVEPGGQIRQEQFSVRTDFVLLCMTLLRPRVIISHGSNPHEKY